MVCGWGQLTSRDYETSVFRGSVRSTRSLGTTITARRKSIGISIGMLPQTLIMSITVEKTSKYYTTEFDLEEGFLNGACISISNLPENIAWQIHRLEAQGPLKSGTWGGRPHLPPSNAASVCLYRLTPSLGSLLHSRVTTGTAWKDMTLSLNTEVRMYACLCPGSLYNFMVFCFDMEINWPSLL